MFWAEIVHNFTDRMKASTTLGHRSCWSCSVSAQWISPTWESDICKATNSHYLFFKYGFRRFAKISGKYSTSALQSAHTSNNL